ncbi:polyprenyl synthetase family protein [Candidatus Woesearchaeota archaeon]|nr:polyprenyl synthetase family protein [Candidatus Woesearchaeota archaeon]
MIKAYQAKINKELENFFDLRLKESDGNLKPLLISLKSYIGNGGKRIRPVSMIIVYEDLIKKPIGRSNINNIDNIYLPAIAIELLHNATLCHDDIMDEDQMRRGEPSCHKIHQEQYLDIAKEITYKGDIFSRDSMRYGTSMAIMAGNILNHFAYECIIQSRFGDKIIRTALNRFTDTIIKINYGQVQDMAFENFCSSGKDVGVNEEPYLEMVSNKTAALLGCSLELGGLFAGQYDNTCKKLYNIGINLGTAFQVIDDLMDIDPNKNKGNTFGSDIIKKKKTLLSIYAANKADSKQKRLMSKQNMDLDDIKTVIQIYHDTGAVKYAMALAEEMTNKAITLIADLKLNRLSELANLLLKRVN